MKAERGECLVCGRTYALSTNIYYPGLVRQHPPKGPVCPGSRKPPRSNVDGDAT